MTFERTLGVCALMLSCALTAGATDPWEADPEDDGPATATHLPAGASQAGRDLEGPSGTPDQDWVWIWALPHHSYEARVSGGPQWTEAGGFQGAQLDLLNTSLVVAVPGDNVEMPNLRGQVLRFQGSSEPSAGYLRVRGPAVGIQGSQPYLLELFDTTYALPRWNNSGSQVTVVVVQNVKPTPVTGSLVFFNANGVQLHAEPLSIEPNAVRVFNTATVSGLVGQSGSARVVHFGGRGALAGKGVALEPATGFTFDTALVPVLP
jgi:hypothetical protein